jgi:hypothetical protein
LEAARSAAKRTLSFMRLRLARPIVQTIRMIAREP